jgi:Family of unknown function (DUF5994)
MIHPLVARRRAAPIRLSLSNELGHDIDGAWWPRTDRIGGELPELVVALSARLGEITGMNVNWPPLQRPPDLNWQGWQQRQQHVITINGWETCANLLIIPYATNSTLALMMLRRAANLSVDPAHCDTAPFHTAGSILYAARQQRAADRKDSAAPR